MISTDQTKVTKLGEHAPQRRIQNFFSKSTRDKYIALALQSRRVFPRLPIPLRLPFGAWWVAEASHLDHGLIFDNFESAEIRFVEKFLKPGMTVVDIGAHHGLYSLLASKRVGSTGKVIAFEPSPREQRRLTRHIRVNRSRNVHIEKCALGDETGEAQLFLADGAADWCNSLRQPATEAASQTVRVAIRRLDDVLSELGVRCLDFVKLDVEGGELGVLKGAVGLLSGSSRPVILAEIYDIRTEPWGYRANEIVRFLARREYQWFAIGEDGSLQLVSSDNDSYDANLCAIPSERVQENSIELVKQSRRVCQP